MNNYLMRILLVVFALSAVKTALSQFNFQEIESYHFSQSIFETSRKTSIPGLVTDPLWNYKMKSPIMLASSAYGYEWRSQNNFIWTGNITTMSYNQGKFGTYFYWDVQGNLRGTRGFIDISGKNKRGLKLTFLWRSMSRIKFN